MAIKAGNILYVIPSAKGDYLWPKRHITQEIIDTLWKCEYYNREIQLGNSIAKFEAWQRSPGFNVRSKKK